MMELPPQWTAWLLAYPWIETLGALLLLIIAAWLLNLITKRVLVRGILNLLTGATARKVGDIRHYAFISRLSNIVPALVITRGIAFVPGLSNAAVNVVENVGNAFIALTIALAVAGVLDLGNAIYQTRPDAANRPIKGYLQIIKILVYAAAVLSMIAFLLERDPLILLSGLGALAAVLMLVFQDTILSAVASVQIGQNDMIRVGDWIEMPGLNADGDVTDIALHTITVQNWDRTITTIPTKRFISDSFKNWRGMQESGGRRIKRALYLDQNSVHFLNAEEQAHVERFSLLKDYLHAKQEELKAWNAQLSAQGEAPVNTRRITNLGTFRAYVLNYLKTHPHVHQDMTLIVRQLNPGPEGLPLEIYCFTNTTAWVAYEGIQSDIFDHLLAILPEFGLRVFQQPTGTDMRELGRNDRALTSLGEVADS